MSRSVVILVLLICAVIPYAYRNQKRYDVDPAQHQLADLLIAAATDEGGVCTGDVVAALVRSTPFLWKRYGRLMHALRLARTKSPQNYDKIGQAFKEAMIAVRLPFWSRR